jgi:hypothetical protein
MVVSASGRLTGAGGEDQLPTILVVAHYDAGAGAPGLAVGADSNGSGVAMLLELARLFSPLYASSRNIIPGWFMLVQSKIADPIHSPSDPDLVSDLIRTSCFTPTCIKMLFTQSKLFFGNREVMAKPLHCICTNLPCWIWSFLRGWIRIQFQLRRDRNPGSKRFRCSDGKLILSSYLISRYRTQCSCEHLFHYLKAFF